MDYIIFRQTTNDFVRFGKGEIAVFGDEEEMREELNIERNNGTNPIVLQIHYSQPYFDSMGNRKRVATIANENGSEFDYIIYSLADDSCFTNALNDWAKEDFEVNDLLEVR